MRRRAAELRQSTRGVDIEPDCTDIDSAYINMIDFIASSQRSIVTKTPTTVPGKTIGLVFPGWVRPRSGVAFEWVREGEVEGVKE